MKDSKGNIQESKIPKEIKNKEKKPMGSSSKKLQQSNFQESKRDL
jgi:hypothetical protein